MEVKFTCVKKASVDVHQSEIGCANCNWYLDVYVYQIHCKSDKKKKKK